MFQRRSSLPEGILNEFALIARVYRAEAKVKILHPAPCTGCPYTRACAD
jgi:predicted Zn-ribbon and HTH transcriptional regulator